MHGGADGDGADSGARLRGIGGVDGEQEDPAYCDELDWFSAAVLVSRQFVDDCLMNKEDVNKALDKCSASSSAG